MTYKVTAHTPKGNLTVEVEGESKFLCLDLARHYFRAAFGEDVDNDIWWKEVEDTEDMSVLERIKRTSHAIAMMDSQNALDEQVDCIKALQALRKKLEEMERAK